MKAYIVHDSPLGTDYSGAGMYALITDALVEELKEKEKEERK